MSWAVDALRSRVSVPIVLGGAVLIMALVRLTSLLPEKYYFRFSTLVGSDGSPFIVEPPGVTYARLCNLVQKHNLGDTSAAVNLAGCARALQTPDARAEKSWGLRNEGALYRAVFANDDRLRQELASAAATMSLGPITPSEIEADIKNASNLEDAIAAITHDYHEKVQERISDLIAKQPEKFTTLNSFLQKLPPPDTSAPEVESEKEIDAKAKNALLRAVRATNAAVVSPIPDLPLEPIGKSKLDEYKRFASSPEDLSQQILGYYVDQIANRYSAQLTLNLKNEGIDPTRDKRVLDNLIRDDAMRPYLISVALRIAPVLAWGLLIGLACGAREIGSAGFAAALAAFLLAWPMVLLWDRVVNYTWQDKRQIFFAFYILYVLSFFIAARFAAGVGATLRPRLPGVRGQIAGELASGSVRVGIFRDLIIALIVNALFYVGTAFMTLMT